MTPSQTDIVAAAIANARGGRRGVPPIKNILSVLPQKLVDEVKDDAAAVLSALKATWQPIETAPKDGTAFLSCGRHVGSPPDAQRGVVAGDHWWSIILWDIWRTRIDGGQRWVFAKDGTPTWAEPTHWMQLPAPPAEPPP